MTPTIIPEYLLPALQRYREQYGWNWTITTRLINRYYGTEYTVKELRQIYAERGRK